MKVENIQVEGAGESFGEEGSVGGSLWGIRAGVVEDASGACVAEGETEGVPWVEADPAEEIPSLSDASFSTYLASSTCLAFQAM